jgi:hypothetical protein
MSYKIKDQNIVINHSPPNTRFYPLKILPNEEKHEKNYFRQGLAL